jgi:LPS-assembly lipoprotein
MWWSDPMRRLWLSASTRATVRPPPRRPRDRADPLRLALLRCLTVLLLPLLLTACGFHLRGAVGYPFDTLYLNAPSAPGFAAELRRLIEGSKGTRMVDSPAGAAVILDIVSVVDDKQVLSLSGGGRVREFALSKRVAFNVHDSDGRDWLPAAEIVVRRSYTFNETEVLARDAQEQRLLAEMQTDAVQQVLRRLQAAKKPG